MGRSFGVSKRESPYLLRGPVFEKPQRASRRKQTDSGQGQRGSARPLVVRKCPIRQGQVARIWLEGLAGKTNRQRDVTPDRDLNRSRYSNEAPQGQSRLRESGSHQSAKQFGRESHQSRLSVMPVDTVWDWYWAPLGNSKTTSYIYSEARKTKKVNN